MRQPILVASLLFTIASLADATTNVAILEFGVGGSVHASQSPRQVTTVQGITSFWGALHGKRRNLQHSGLTVVPDLFKRPDDGVVIAFDVEELDPVSMPYLSKLVSGEDPQAVGIMRAFSTSSKELVSGLPNFDIVSPTAISESCKKHLDQGGFSGIMIERADATPQEIDANIADALDKIKSFAETQSKTIVVHVVVNEPESSSRRRLSSRQLEEGNAADNQDNAAADENNNNNKDYSGYYGFGYYNSFGEWVTPFKTMFQIQYFNVVLWTAIGLVAVLFFVIGLMVYMPLEPDTLLFGESAKFVGDD